LCKGGGGGGGGGEEEEEEEDSKQHVLFLGTGCVFPLLRRAHISR
jgi:hypothetical protein